MVGESGGHRLRPSHRKLIKAGLSIGTNLIIPILFLTALYLLHKTLKNYHFHDILDQIKSTPPAFLFLAISLTILDYWVLTGFDYVGIRYAGANVRYRKTVLTGFLAYAFSHNVGVSWLSGGSIRYRLYSGSGLSAIEITKVVVSCNITVFLGFLTVSGIAFIVEPLQIPASIHFPLSNLHFLGFVFLIPVLGYLAIGIRGNRTIKIIGYEIPVPSRKLVLAQVLISSVDWLLASGVAYLLISQGKAISFPAFVGVFLFSTMAGIVSHVPGGIGVFESLMLLFLTPAIPVPFAMGGLVAFRVIYYIVPLLLASTLLGVHEFLQRKIDFSRVIQLSQSWLGALVPQLIGFLVFFAGVVLLVSGATPSLPSRLLLLRRFVPLPVVEVSHFLGSLLGLGLLLLAWSLRKRIDAAYHLTLGFLGLGALVSLLKGFDYEEAIILALMFLVVLPCHRHFYRKSSLLNETFTLHWFIAIGLAVAGSIWLGIFTHKHVNYSHDLWWQFAFHEDAPRFLRSTAGVIAAILLLAIYRLLKPTPRRLELPTESALEKIASIIRECPRTTANLAFLGDKAILLNDENTAFIMYDIEDRSWVVMGDPVGPPEETRELVWRFRELCDDYDGYPVFYQVSPENLSLYLDLGLSLLKLGEEARVGLREFSLDGSARKDLRHVVNKIERLGFHFEVLPADEVQSKMEVLKDISDAWLANKNTQEKKFSLAFFKPDYVARFPSAVVKKGEEIVAFANVLEGAGKEELSIDLMRYRPDSPNGTMEYLFTELMLWGKWEGYQWFNLGMAPLSGLENRSLAPLWNRVGSLVFRHGEHFYHFEGLRRYKQKFDPIWTPKYLACPGGFAVPRVLTHIATLTSGSLVGVVTK
ncbi:MAG: bifunctional lysylphosphatidylglycerol flippase/synthetase MprF [Candidatus Omnitrophica bacterium]|nr:bifunctional lysylphosphatidylglycerol flippase/synthetase MprF [Candidatus Omnitrophota bacterium]